MKASGDLFPFQPLAEYLADREEIDAAIQRVLSSGQYILGTEGAAFEQEFAAWFGVKETVGVASGTDALALALRACGIGSGDVVLTVSHTAVATVAAIELVGAEPLLADIAPASFTMNVTQLADELRADVDRKIKAVVPVHLYGHPVDMQAIMKLAAEYHLRVIEDCAQSHGASFQGRVTGTWGDAAAFSFYPTKNLGAMGDGGAVVTNDPEIARRVRSLRQYGWKQRYISDVAGMNSRLDEIQAAILRVKLRRLDWSNARRRELAALYTKGLAGTSLGLPQAGSEVVHVFHQYVVRVPRREELVAHLKEAGIPSAVLYPQPVHLQPAYRGRVRVAGGGLPVTEKAAGEVLSLPLHPRLEEEAIGRVIEVIVQSV